MSKIAVVYYSYGNNTKKIADMIQSKKDVELFRIEPVTPYTGSYNKVVDEGKKEIDSGMKRPIQALNIHLDQYDTIIIGTPVWWYTMAPVVSTFLAETDLSGKKIVPFATNAGWLGHTFQDIEKLCPASKVEEGMSIQFSESTLKTSIKAIESWIEAI